MDREMLNKIASLNEKGYCITRTRNVQENYELQDDKWVKVGQKPMETGCYEYLYYIETPDGKTSRVDELTLKRLLKILKQSLDFISDCGMI